MTPRSSAEGYGGAESATVYGPDGQTLNVTRNDERFRWTPEQTGTHTIRLTYSNTIGGEFTETVRVGVEENPASTPPTVRVTDGIGGNLLLAGDGLESGSISVDGANAKVVAQAPGDNAPSSLDIHAEQLAVDSMDVSVVMGTDRARSTATSHSVSGRTSASRTHSYSDSPASRSRRTNRHRSGAFETRTSESGQRASGCRDLHRSRRHDHGTGPAQPESSRPGELPDRNLGHRPAVLTLSTTPPMSLPTNHDRSTSR